VIAPRRIVLEIVVAALLFVRAAAAAGPGERAYEASLICESCHSGIYGEWEGSSHAAAWEDSLFQDLFAAVRSRAGGVECLACHAPVAVHDRDPMVMEGTSREGVNCDYCHTLRAAGEGGGVPVFRSIPDRTRTGRTGRGSSIYHGIRGEAEFGSPEYCATCHHLRNRHGVLIYSEYESWRRSGYPERGIDCRSCHMPESTAKASDFGSVRGDVSGHRFRGGGSLEMLRKAAGFEVELTALRDSIRVRTAVRNRGAGHMLPGGIPIRELVIRVIGRDASGKDLFEEAPIRYGVELEFPAIDSTTVDSLNVWDALAVREDTRIRPGEKRIGTLSLPRAAALDRLEMSLLYYPIPLSRVEARELEMEPIEIYRKVLRVE
jgi:hypothetical protein